MLRNTKPHGACYWNLSRSRHVGQRLDNDRTGRLLSAVPVDFGDLFGSEML